MSVGAIAVAPSRTVSPKQVGIAGIVIAALAWVITIPPIEVRGIVPSIVLAAIAVGAGAWSIAGGERKIGSEAIVVALFAVAGAAASANSATSTLESVFTWSALVAATLRYATPLLFGALGGLISERSGVINVGLEGMMLMGCFWGIYGADLLGSWVWGIVVAVVAGGLLALIHAFFSVHLRANQIVSGFGINFLALGITGYFLEYHYGPNGTPLNISMVPNVRIPLIQHLGFFGAAFGDANLMTWIGIALVPALTYLPVPHARGPAAAVSRREAARRRHRGRVRRADPVRRRGRLRHVRGARRGLPLGRLRRVVQQRHDQRPGLHRAGGDDLRKVEAVGSAVGVPAVRIRKRHVRPGLERQPDARDAVRGAAVRSHPGRGRGARGPLAAAGRGRHSVREGVAGTDGGRPASPDQLR